MHLNEQQKQAIERDIFAGRKVAAIKLYRDATGVGLAEAKRAVEDMEVDLRRQSPELFIARKSGCSTVAACVVAVVAIATVISHYIF